MVSLKKMPAQAGEFFRSKTSSATETAQFLHDLHIASAITHMKAFIRTSSKTVRVSHLHAILSLYTKAPALTALFDYVASFDDVAVFFMTVTEAYASHTNNTVPTPTPPQQQEEGGVDDGQVIQAVGDAITENIAFNPLAEPGQRWQLGNLRDIIAPFMVKWATPIRFITGVVIFICALFGIKQALKIPDLKDLLTAVTALGGMLGNCKSSFTVITGIVDTVLKVVYQFFGVEYVKPEYKHLSELSTRVMHLYDRATDIQRQMRVDAFGLQASGIGEIEALYASLKEEVFLCTNGDKSNFNFAGYMTEIHAILNDLRTMMSDLYKSSVGKQHPTVVWFCGPPNTGKTRTMHDMAALLARDFNSCPYPRTLSDEYWSGYAYNPVVTYDDIGQHVDKKDIVEFHAYSTEDSRDVTGAAIEKKGRPFASQYILCSSNSTWICPPVPLEDMLAVNRRRHFVVYCHNPAVQAYSDENNGTFPNHPDWWRQHPNKLYFINPTFGAHFKNANNQKNMKFNPSGPYVIRETNMDEVYRVARNQELFYREQYRQKYVALFGDNPNAKFTIPREPIAFDEQLLPGVIFSSIKPLVGPPRTETEIAQSLECTDAEAMGARYFDDHNEVIECARISKEDGRYTSSIDVTVFKAVRGEIVYNYTTNVEVANFERRRLLNAPPKEFVVIEETPQGLRVFARTRGESGTRTQANVVSREVKRTYQPSVVLYGPPGTGKTFLVRSTVPAELLYEVPWVENIDYAAMEGKVVLLDDFLLDAERMRTAKDIVSSYYEAGNPRKIRLVIMTANWDTQFANSLTEDDKTFFLRRSHAIRVEYSLTLKAYTSVWGGSHAAALKGYECRESGVSVSWEMYERNMHGVKPSLGGVKQLLNDMIKNSSVVNTTVEFLDVVLPAPKQPNLVVNIALTHNAQPDWKHSSFVKCNYDDEGNALPGTALSNRDMYEIGKSMLPILNELRQTGIMNPGATVDVVNQMCKKVDLPFADTVINIAGNAFGVTQICGQLMMYRIQNIDYVINIVPTGVWINGTFYGYENELDVNIAAFLSRTQQVPMAQPNLNVEVHTFVPKPIVPIAEFVENSPIVAGIRKITACIDIAAIIGSSAAILMSSDSVTNAPEERQIEEETQVESHGHQQRRGGVREFGADHGHTDAREDDLHDTHQRREKTSGSGPRLIDGHTQGYWTSYWQAVGKGVRTKQVMNGVGRGTSTPIYVDKSTNKRFYVLYNEDIKKCERVYLECFAGSPIDKNKMYRVMFERDGYRLWGILYDKQVYYADPLDATWTKYRGCVIAYDEIQADQWHVPSQSSFQQERAALDKTRGVMYNIEKEDGGELFQTFFAHYFVRECGERGVPCKEHAPKLHSAMPPLQRHLDPENRRKSKDGNNNQGAYDPEAIRRVPTLEKNRVKIVNQAGDFLLSGIMLKQRLGLTTQHVFALLPPDEKFLVEINDKFYDVDIINQDVFNDISTFQIRDNTLPSFPDITNHIPSRSALAAFAGNQDCRFDVLIPIHCDNVLVTQMCNAKVESERTPSKKGENGRFAYTQKMTKYGTTGVTKPGDCGSPIILVSPTMGKKFAGIHIRGSDSKSVGAILTSEYVTDMLTSTEAALPEDGQHVQSVIPHRAIHYHDEDDGCLPQDCSIAFLGTPKVRVHVPDSTKKYRSLFDWEAVMQDYESRKTEPTILSKFDPRHPEGRDLYKEALLRYGGDDIPIPAVEIDIAVEDISNELISLMYARDLKLRMLTTTEAINTPHTNEFPSARPIDRSGSVGFPYAQTNSNRASKNDYLERNEKDGNYYWKKNDADAEQICSDINQLIQNGRRGIHMHQPWIAYLKDEPQKCKKIYDAEKVKTRMFFGGTFAYYLAYRRAFGAAMFRLTELFEHIPPKVGISSRSLDWDTMITSMCNVSPTGFASDMSNWDGCVPSAFLRALPRIYNNLYTAMDPNCTDADNLLRITLHRSVEGAIIVAKENVVQFSHGMTSGFPGTAIENSLVNWMLFYLVYRRIMNAANLPHTWEDFTRDVKLAVYGDDNVCAVRPEVENVFNFNTFKYVAAMYGFTVTDAAKSGEEQPDVMPVIQCDFLKRKTHKLGPYWVGKLDMDSIIKSLTWQNSSPSYSYRGEWRTNTNVADHERMIQAALPEVACHGREVYDDFRMKCLKALRGKEVNVRVPNFDDFVATQGYHA